MAFWARQEQHLFPFSSDSISCFDWSKGFERYELQIDWLTAKRIKGKIGRMAGIVFPLQYKVMDWIKLNKNNLEMKYWYWWGVSISVLFSALNLACFLMKRAVLRWRGWMEEKGCWGWVRMSKALSGSKSSSSSRRITVRCERRNLPQLHIHTQTHHQTLSL